MQERDKARWPRIALSVSGRRRENGDPWLDIRHDTTERGVFKISWRRNRKSKTTGGRNYFIEDAETREVSAEFSRHVVKDRRGNFFWFRHWAEPPEQLTIGGNEPDPSGLDRWPSIALSATVHYQDNEKFWLDIRHHTTWRSVYTLYQQPERKPRKIDRHGDFIEDAETRFLSAKWKRHIVKNRQGNLFHFRHWAWPPKQLTFERDHLVVISRDE